jgi:predicted small lipoprotein YifL
MKPYKLLLLLPLSTGLAGCGQPGPLYLPVEGKAAPIHVAPKPKPVLKPEPNPEKNK